jgi:Fur family ferric uptake transcriptional regulator
MPGPYKLKKRYGKHMTRWTAPREAILDLLSRSKRHLSAKEIYASLYDLYPGIGLTTVYRTMDLLNRTGIINKIAASDNQARYELKSQGDQDHHHHLICTHCGKIIDYKEFEDEELTLIKKTERRLSKKYNFKISDHNIEFIGICGK